jgi:hypothetical protein
MRLPKGTKSARQIVMLSGTRMGRIERRENKGCVARIPDDAATMISSFAMMEIGPFALGVGVLGVIAVVALAFLSFRKKA